MDTARVIRLYEDDTTTQFASERSVTVIVDPSWCKSHSWDENRKKMRPSLAFSINEGQYVLFPGKNLVPKSVAAFMADNFYFSQDKMRDNRNLTGVKHRQELIS
jgi:hypothetical protein